MKYFQNLDKITYDNGEYAVRDIFDRVLIDNISEDYISYYNVSEGHKQLYLISYELYRTVEHWWVLALLNKTFDLFYDMQLDTDTIQNIVETQVDGADVIAMYNEIDTENREKQYIKIIKPSKINEVIAKVVSELT